MYRIKLHYWVYLGKPSNRIGYNAWDYLPGSSNLEFDTRAEANTHIKKHHKGPDAYGVYPIFKVEGVS